ncbi:MAG TPA: cache domain-containing protein [Nitrospira sp.]|nr:cache domain-containing protein [Nitrospira sp.]
MKFQNQILLYALLPTLVALSLIAFTVHHQAQELAQSQRESWERTYRASKDDALKHYCAMATKAIAPLYESDRFDVVTIEQAKKDAATILANLDYGPDGYFFLYDFQGRLLMHPRQPQLVGHNLASRAIGKDGDSKQVIKDLIEAAQQGKEFVDYWWSQPSTHTDAPVPKRACVIALKRWEWVLGTGMYLDDIDTAINEAAEQASQNISSTMLLVAVFSSFGVAIMSVGIMRLIRAHVQDEERNRIANALHDSINPLLVASKQKIQLGIRRLQRITQRRTLPPATFREATELMDQILADLKQVIQDLDPSDLKHNTLDSLLQTLADRFTSDERRVEANIIVDGTKSLPLCTQKTLYHVAQLALTNAATHSSATHVSLHLEIDAQYVTFTTQDNGAGFEVEDVRTDPYRGRGLCNMQRKIEVEGGEFQLTSSPSGTTIIVRIPLERSKGLSHGGTSRTDQDPDR